MRWTPLFAALLATACSSSSPTVPPPLPSPPGVTFTWPKDGQSDVVTGTRIVVHLSGPPDVAALAPCTSSGGTVAGTFCLVSDAGVVPTSPQISGDTVYLSIDGGLAADTSYQLYVRPALLPDAGNLPATAPIATFHTRPDRAQAGLPLTVVTVNDDPPAAFLQGGAGPTLPFLVAASIRILFSAPLDLTQVNAASVQVTQVISSGNETPVSGTLLAKGTRITFDPDADLQADATYHLHLSQLADIGGDQLAPIDLYIKPQATGPTYPQTLGFAPPVTAGSTPSPSTLSGLPLNTNTVSSPLIGLNTLGLTSGGLQVNLADPSAFNGPIPMIVRKGQSFPLQALPIEFGGVLNTGLSTGPIHLTVLADSVGFMMRSPWRDSSQIPDDNSPPFVDITLDVALSSDDPLGNTLSTQTQLGLRLLGISTVDGMQLAVDQFGATEISTLGIANAPSNMALRLETGATLSTPAKLPMSLISSYPAAGDTNAPPDTKIELNFSAPLDASLALPSSTLGLTENGNAVPITTQVDGSTLIVVPSRRLADDAQFVLSYGAINGVDGTPGAAGTLSFSTPVYSLQNPTAPILLTLIPGAPCALSGAVAPGSCAGGQSTDPSYLPFTLESNRSIVAAFSQPMNPSTLMLGTTCGTGAIRIEEDDANGNCTEPVPGVLQLSDRGFRFTPNAPWTPGAAYVMTLIAGPDSNCDLGEICSAQGTPFNTAPLSGFSAGAGGPDVVIPFTGIAATQDSFQPLQTNPFADLNGNGVFDSDETPQDSNRVGMVISGTGFPVTSASFNGPYCGTSTTEACSYLYAQMPASVGPVLQSCPLDVNAQPTSNGGPCLQVRLWPGIILSTSMSMNSTVVGFVPLNNINTGALLMRTRESTTPQLGYILSDPNSSSPQLVLQQSLYVDAPDLSILDGLVSHDLKSKPISFNFKGPVTFLPDGRMSVAVTNLDDETLTVNLSSFGITAGSIEMLIAAGELHITLAGPLLR